MINRLESFSWLSLMIGNSRLHWAFFTEDTLQQTWNSEHLTSQIMEKELPQNFPSELNSLLTQNLPLYIASVVPSQTQLWQDYPNKTIITLDNIPLQGLYETLGIDRALAVLGAGETYEFPCLVIDAGTALTFTGVNSDRQLIGGAILPGLGLQLQSLGTKTAALPAVSLPEDLPSRWARNTSEAIASGVIYTLLAGIKEFIEKWWIEFPNAKVILTGGDSQLLEKYLQSQYPELAQQVNRDEHLIFLGIKKVVNMIGEEGTDAHISRRSAEHRREEEKIKKVGSINVSLYSTE